jgi:hypothetical protein
MWLFQRRRSCDVVSIQFYISAGEREEEEEEDKTIIR